MAFHGSRSRRALARDGGALWAFCRPHTMLGTVLAVVTLYAVAANAQGRHDPGLLLIVAVASLSVNVYVVGLNQITDVDIDRINKPHLPMASGALASARARHIVTVAGAMALTFAALGGPWLVATIVAVGCLGSAYSLPPIRLKRRPLAAAASITSARAIVGNFGVYLTYASALTGDLRIPVHLGAFVAFMVGFMIAIAILKDAPDTEGDRRHGVLTYTIRFGTRRIARAAAGILAALYGGMMVFGLFDASGLHRAVTTGGHALALGALVWLSRRCDFMDRTSLSRFYGGVWVLFYFEFPLYAAACLLAAPART